MAPQKKGLFGRGAGPVRAVSGGWLLTGCLVSRLVVAWVCGCGCRHVLLIFGGGGWLLAGLLAFFLVGSKVGLEQLN